MIETVMIFALGFLCAGLLALLFLPAFWRRAMRLSTRRLELQMPLSMSEIVAERDQLRAEFAAERRRLEQKSEKLAMAVARERAELGTRSTRILALEDELGERSSEADAAKELVERYERLLSENEAERVVLEKVLFDTDGTLNRRQEELRRLREDHAALGETADRQRVAIAGLETRSSGLEMDVARVQSDCEKLEKNLAEKISLAQFLERERDQFHSDAVAARGRRDALQERVNAQQEKIGGLDAELRSKRREIAALRDALEHAESRLKQSEDRAEQLKVELRNKEDDIEGRKGALAAEIEAQTSQQSVLRGALDAARRENQNLRMELTHLRSVGGAAKDEQGDAGTPAPDPRFDSSTQELRLAISEVGNELIRLTETLKNNEPVGLAKRVDIAEKMEALQERARSAEGASG